MQVACKCHHVHVWAGTCNYTRFCRLKCVMFLFQVYASSSKFHGSRMHANCTIANKWVVCAFRETAERRRIFWQATDGFSSYRNDFCGFCFFFLEGTILVAGTRQQPLSPLRHGTLTETLNDIPNPSPDHKPNSKSLLSCFLSKYCRSLCTGKYYSSLCLEVLYCCWLSF